MIRLENLNVELLNRKELCEVNGGEDGWYYVARYAKWWYNNVVYVVENIGHGTTTQYGIATGF